MWKVGQSIYRLIAWSGYCCACHRSCVVLLRRCGAAPAPKPNQEATQAPPGGPPCIHPSIHRSRQMAPSGTWCPVLWLSHTCCCRPRVVARRRRGRRRRPDDNAAPALHPLPRAQPLLIPSNRSRPRPPCVPPRPPPPAAAAAPTRWSPHTGARPAAAQQSHHPSLPSPFPGGGRACLPFFGFPAPLTRLATTHPSFP